MGQLPDVPTPPADARSAAMNRFLIERTSPNAGTLTAADLQGIARTSNGVLAKMPDVQWVQSCVTDDAITCVYLAQSEDAVREHARCGGFPADEVRRVVTVIDPTTAG
jgi:hypothetical protein